jgi:hypothetical protein
MKKKIQRNKVTESKVTETVNRVSGESMNISYLHQWSKRWKMTSDSLLGATIARDYQEVYMEFNVIQDLMNEFIEFRKICQEIEINIMVNDDVLKVSNETIKNGNESSDDSDSADSTDSESGCGHDAEK